MHTAASVCQSLNCADEGSGEIGAVPVRPQDLVMQLGHSQDMRALVEWQK